ncbi:MAG: methyltransferase domain-containing protein [Hyphomonadaceae bacterium]|nr:methyltransferase domain-containing protein [Hyphomonadaceae bacterium]
MNLRLKFAVAVAALALAGCASTPKGPPPLAAADYATILADPARTAADKNDDAARKPAEVLAFAQIRPGDTVLELEGGRGWYSDILSGAVGPTGKLYIQYPPEFAYGDAAYKARTDAGRLTNATILKTHFDTYAIPDASVDKVIWILGPHEVYFTPPNTQGLGDPVKTYAEIKRVLKPGGEFIAMDHAADAGAEKVVTASTLHRVDPAIVLAAAKDAGLVYVEKSDILANPQDDRTKRVFDATIRRHTDQFLFRFKKTG